MAQKCGFFNAQMVAGLPDRQYNADDYANNLAVVISPGVLRSANDDLKVSSSGLDVTVAAGRAWINGRYYWNTAPYTFATVTPPVSGSRIDRVVLRLDTSLAARSITLAYVTGTASASPTAPALTRSGSIYELGIATVSVASGASGVTVTDTRADATVCGWVYSTSGDDSFFTSLDNAFNAWFTETKDTLASVTLFKRYSYEETLQSLTSAITFNIPQYDAETCFIEVFVNGFNTTAYTLSGATITFSAALDAGTDVLVFAYKSLDGTDIMSVSDEITQLQTQMAALNGVSLFTYKAVGSDDNITLSDIIYAIQSHEYDAASVTEQADAFLTALGGNTWLASLANDAKVTIHVCGTLGVTSPALNGGDGRKYWFTNNTSAHGSTRVVLDFADADTISITGAASTNNVVFGGSDFDVRNASVVFNGSSSGNVYMFDVITNGTPGRIHAENCRLEVHAGAVACIGTHGTFTNCDGICISESGNAVCFAPASANTVTVVDGRYLAYTKASGTISAVLYTAVGETNAVIVCDMINCPTISKAGYTQGYIAVGNAGNIVGATVISTLSTSGNSVTIDHIIQKNKAW